MTSSEHILYLTLCLKGEDLKKQIGAPAYIECSSKTQQVFLGLLTDAISCELNMYFEITEMEFVQCVQNVKGVFDAAIKVVLQPPKQKKKKKKSQKGCFII